MKSYKDLDKEIILNAPEGAMWVGGLNYYYKLQDSVLYYNPLGREWRVSAYESYQGVIKSLRLIPLPNIEIPWEATADSVCPVPSDTVVAVNARFTSFAGDFWWGIGRDGSSYTKYKIIDEDFVKTVPFPPELKARIESLVEGVDLGLDQPLLNSKELLVERLKFLHNLGNEFPEIYDEVVAEMKVQFECYCEENLND